MAMLGCTVSTRVRQRVRANVVAGILTAYVMVLCVGLFLGPILLVSSTDMAMVPAIKHIIGVVGIAYVLGIAALFR